MNKLDINKVIGLLGTYKKNGSDYYFNVHIVWIEVKTIFHTI